MKQAIKKWAWRLIRLAVVAAALTYVVWNVDWEDHATLADGRKVAAFGIEQRGDGEYVDVARDGVRVWLPEREFKRPQTRIEGQKLPLVTPGLRQAVTGIDWTFIALAILIFSPNYSFLAWRLRLLLRTQDVHLGLFDAIKLSYASAFLNFAVPTGTTGGDIFKAYFIARHATGRRTEAVTIVLLDRVIGLINFVFMAAAVCLLSWSRGKLGPLGGLVTTIFVVSIVGACSFFSQRVRALVRLEQWLPRLPFGPHLVRIDRTAFSLRFHPGTLASAFAGTLFVQTTVCIGAMLVAAAVHMKIGWDYSQILDYFLAVIVGLTVSSLPGNPPQGFGVLEGIMAYILSPHYGGFSQVFAVCIGIRLLHLIWSLPGALVLLLEPRPKVAPTLESLEALEDLEQGGNAPRA